MTDKTKPDAPGEKRFCHRCEKYRTDKEWYDCPGWVFYYDDGCPPMSTSFETETKPCPEWQDLRVKRMP